MTGLFAAALAGWLCLFVLVLAVAPGAARRARGVVVGGVTA
jgi:hypothetical protein